MARLIRTPGRTGALRADGSLTPVAVRALVVQGGEPTHALCVELYPTKGASPRRTLAHWDPATAPTGEPVVVEFA